MTKEYALHQTIAALSEIREKAATMKNGGAWAAGMAALCLGTLGPVKSNIEPTDVREFVKALEY